MPEPETIKQAQYVLNSIITIREFLLNQHLKYIGALHESSLLNGLSVPQAQAIHAIYKRGQVTITELARMQHVSPPSASAMVDRLVEKEILIREPHEVDRRKVAISVSPKVAGEFKELQDAMLQSFVELVEKIGPETAKKWCEVLTQIKAVLAG